LHPVFNVVISYLTAHLQDKSSAPVSLTDHIPLVSREGTVKVVDCVGDAPIGRSDISIGEVGTGADDCNTLPADEPWVVAPDEFSAPPVSSDAFPEQREGETPGPAAPVFLGRRWGVSTQGWYLERTSRCPYRAFGRHLRVQ
jgi:hypothetical protein